MSADYSNDNRPSPTAEEREYDSMSLHDQIGPETADRISDFFHAEATTTPAEALRDFVLGTLSAQLEEPADDWWSLADELGISEDDARSFFDQLSSRLSAAIAQCEAI